MYVLADVINWLGVRMMMIGKCVYCGKMLIPDGCGCVSPFADNAVLAAMRDDLAMEASLKSVVAMMQRMTDDMLSLGDRLRNLGQVVPGITDWLPGDRFPRPNMAIVNPRHRGNLEGGFFDVIESHHVPEDMVYLVEKTIPWTISWHDYESDGE